MFPPPKATSDLRKRHLAATYAWKPGTLIYDDVEYCAATDIDLEGFGLTADGSAAEVNQRLVAHIAKADMESRPTRGAFVQVNGLGFVVESVGGDNEHDEHWEIACRRTPGQDDV